MNKIKFGLISLLIGLSTVGVVSLAPASASTASDAACQGLQQIDTAQTCTAGGAADTAVGNTIKTAISILSYLIGAVAIVVIILAGLKYVTAAGDTSRISSAKNTLVYALVGLAIAALAQVLVHYVLSQAANASNNPAKPGGYLPGISRTAADA